MSRPDPWLTKLRALIGTGVLGWELVLKSGQQWWVFVLCVWLLGGPFEELIRLATSGRIQIRVQGNGDDEAEKKEPLP